VLTVLGNLTFLVGRERERERERERLVGLNLLALARCQSGRHADLFSIMSKKYTVAEVAKHNVIDGPNKSTWVIYEGKVFDITDFVSEHPGGTEVLADTAGTDITRSFTEIGHSDHARSLMTPRLIGEVVRALGPNGLLHRFFKLLPCPPISSKCPLNERK